MGTVQDYRERREKRLAERGIFPEEVRRLIEYEIRKAKRLGDRGYRADDDAEEVNKYQNRRGGSEGGHGNTRLPFGLCMRYGIPIEKGWGPGDAWAALAGKGITAKGAYEKLKKGEDPGAPETPEIPKEPVKKIHIKIGDMGADYDKLDSYYDSWASRGEPKWRLTGEVIKDSYVEPDEWWKKPSSRISKAFYTKTDMLRWLKEQGVEEFKDPESKELVNPKEMEFPEPVMTLGTRGFSAVTIGLRDGRYTVIGTDFDGTKKKLDDYSSLKDAKEYIRDHGGKDEDIKMSSALKKREKERLAWLTSDKKEYIEQNGKKYGDLTLDENRYWLTGTTEEGEWFSKRFETKTDAMSFLKGQGVESVKIGDEKTNPMEYEIPDTKFTVHGRGFQEGQMLADEFGRVTVQAKDLDGDWKVLGVKGPRETVEEFKQRMEASYGVKEEYLDVPEESKKHFEEIAKEEEKRKKLAEEFEQKAVEVPGHGRYADLSLVETPSGRYKIIGYNKYGEPRDLTYWDGDIYDMEESAHLMGLDMESLSKSDKVKDAYEKFKKNRAEFEEKAVPIRGEKFLNPELMFDGRRWYLEGYDERGRKREIDREPTYKAIEDMLSTEGYTTDSFAMSGSAKDEMKRVMKNREAIASGEYYEMGVPDRAFKDAAVEKIGDYWYITATDIDGDKIDDIGGPGTKSLDDVLSKMSGFNVTDYKMIKDGQEVPKPKYGMHKVMIARKIGGGYVVYADSHKFGKHAVMYESPKEEDARKWLRDNNVEESMVKTRGMNPNDDAVRNPPTKALEGFDTHRMEAIANTYLDNLSKEDKQDFADMLTELFTRGAYRTARSTDSLAGILENGYLSQIETGTGGHGAYLGKAKRKKCSEEILGHGPMKNHDYEKIGYLAPDDIAEDYDSGDHPWYGGSSPMTYTFKKDNMKDRVTYTFGDSLNTWDWGRLKSAGYAGEHPTIEGMSALPDYYADEALDIYRRYKNQETGRHTFSDMFERMRQLANNNYVELQYTGDVTAKDIEKISFDKKKYIEDAFGKMTQEERARSIKILRDNGIGVEFRERKGSPFKDGWEWLKEKYPECF